MSQGTVVFLEPKGTILEVIREAKAQGYRVAALITDPSLLEQASEPYVSAVSLIDRVVQIPSWNDRSSVFAGVDEIADRNRIVGIYSGVDPCAELTAELRARYQLPTTAPEVLKLILDKFRLRKRLQEKGLSKLRNFMGAEVDQWTDWKFQGPAYFKPVHGFFSAYVKRCESLHDVRIAKEEWARGRAIDSPFIRNYLGTDLEYHLEEAFVGELLSVESICQNGMLVSLGITSRILFSKNPIVEMGSCFPYPHPLSNKIIDLVRQTHVALDFTEGPSHTELIVSPDGEVEIIDWNPRFVGADVLQSINHAYGIRIERALLDYALGRPISLSLELKHYCALQYILPPQVASFQNIQYPKNPDVRFQTTFLKPGTVIGNHERQLDYVGCYLTVGDSFTSALERSRALRESVHINHTYPGVF